MSHASIGSLTELLPFGALAVLAGVLNSQLSPNAKARVVFMRWTNPLPGSRAFSHYARSDQRIDVSALARKVGPVPQRPQDQNALWYRLYRSVREEPAVREAHQHFLLWRDYATMIVLLTLLFVPATAVLTQSVRPPLLLLTVLALQFGLTTQAARVHAERLVCNVLAIKASQDDTGA